jgi:hypothetical protein
MAEISSAVASARCCSASKSGRSGAYGPRFDIDLWAMRLIAATRWLQAPREPGPLLGYFGVGDWRGGRLDGRGTLGPVIRARVSWRSP